MSLDLVPAPPPGLKKSGIIIPFPPLFRNTLYYRGHAPYLGKKRGKGEKEKSVRTRERDTIKKYKKKGRYSKYKGIERIEREREKYRTTPPLPPKRVRQVVGGGGVEEGYIFPPPKRPPPQHHTYPP